MKGDHDRRIRRLEGAMGEKPETAIVFVCRPPDETREEWLSRKAGNPLPSHFTNVNALGETWAKWHERKAREREALLAARGAKDADEAKSSIHEA